VVESEVAALARAGHDVALFAARTDDLEGDRLYPLKAGLRVATGRGASPLAALARFGPDVVHVHNLFPNFGRRWVRSVDVPLVTTLHNYRPLCVNGLLYRDGKVCTLCPDGRRWSGLRYACYRDSRLASLPLTLANLAGPAADPLLARADRIVVLSDLAAEIYANAGVAPHRMTVWPNFLRADLDPGPDDARAGTDAFLYVGRLSPEKAVIRLLAAWPRGDEAPALRIVGEGPEEAAVRSAAEGRPIEVLGRVSRTEVVALMRRSVGLVFPSAWYEGFPLVYAEAMAAGLPVLAWAPNVVSRWAVADGTGASTSWDEDTGAILALAAGSFPGLRHHCRRLFEKRYSEAAHVARAEALYGELSRGSG
jgi:glycosyltransferase involved in cell wall biosynthesis